MKRIAIVLFIVGLCASNLYAALCSFDRIEGNEGVDISDQLKVNVSSNGQMLDSILGEMVDKVTFKFTNKTGGVDSSITEIYFYDGSLLNMYSIDDSHPNVYFEDLGASTNPGELPGYQPNYELLSVLSATEAENPESKKGVKTGEWIEIGYTLLPGKTFQDLLDDMETREVVIGIHVKSIDQPGGGAESDSFILNTVIVPEPATIGILALGSLLVIRKRRKK
ncbi:MAG: PEP-CTERM sorting domain-containing protein [Planctomycetes bacterium]|nr:PEP-CTERM sorting domain-containing protein [Planctomycetota bacterium]